MKKIARILILALALVLVFGLVSCELPFDLPFLDGKDPGNTDDTGDDDGEDDVDLEGLVLIKGGKANFQVVCTSEAGPSGIRAADELVKQLRALGVEINDPIRERNADDVTECEIIIGTGAKFRGDDCNVSNKYLGAKGMLIKSVGQKIVIAGGTSAKTSEAVSKFIKDYLGITNKTEEIVNLAIQDEIDYVTLTDYLIKSISVAGNDLRNYSIVYDLAGIDEVYAVDTINDFANLLFAESGIWLEAVDLENSADAAHKVVLRYTKEMSNDEDGDGFTVFVDDAGDLIIECSYANAFDTAFGKFLKDEILDEMGDIKFSQSYFYSDEVSVVRYSDFGAKGDGKTDDYTALYNAHIYANDGGQKVLGDVGATYYVHELLTVTIPIKTDTDFMGAKFVVNDTGSIAYKNRIVPLFTLARDHDAVIYKQAQFNEIFGEGVQIKEGDRVFEWLAPELEAKSLIRVTNWNHKDFVRHGSNQNNGTNRQEVYVVEKDGTLEEDCYVAFEFDEITQIEIWRVDDTPIVVENGEFENICCTTVEETKFICLYKSYKRGFSIHRANATIQNVKHTMTNEPILNANDADGKDMTGNKKENVVTYGTRDESYPYYGFLDIYTCYNFNAKDCILDGHTTYYEDKPATASTGGNVPDPVAMGSYDLIIEYSSRTYLTNVVQQDNEGTGLGDQRYWGIMSSNGTRNVFFTDVSVNRFDAHRGFWNATLINTTLGHSFNVIGGGKLYCENVTKITGDGFISFRGDYGAVFHGDIELIDCEHVAMTTYYSNKGDGYYTGSRPSNEDYSRINDTAYVMKPGYSNSNSGAIIYKTDEDGRYILDENGEKIIDRDGRYWFWDFGYTCYMPTNVVIKNYVCGANKVYVFSDLIDDIFSYDITNRYVPTESITFINMDPIPAARANYNVLLSIPVTVITEE